LRSLTGPELDALDRFVEARLARKTCKIHDDRSMDYPPLKVEVHTMSPGNRWPIVITAWLLWSSPALAATTLETGNVLLQDCIQQDHQFCLGYVDAVTDALDGNSVNGYEACVPTGPVKRYCGPIFAAEPSDAAPCGNRIGSRRYLQSIPVPSPMSPPWPPLLAVRPLRSLLDPLGLGSRVPGPPVLG
jgi:hypothetical protein